MGSCHIDRAGAADRIGSSSQSSEVVGPVRGGPDSEVEPGMTSSEGSASFIGAGSSDAPGSRVDWEVDGIDRVTGRARVAGHVTADDRDVT